MLLEFILRLLGTILFFLPGFLLCLIIFKKIDFIERVAYSIIFAISISTIIGVLLWFLRLLKLSYIIISVLILIAILLIVVFYKKNFRLEKPNYFFYLILLFSFVGALFRILIRLKVKNWQSIYSYVGHLASKSVLEGAVIPDLGFYTGIVNDHAHYIGGHIDNFIFQNLLFVNDYFVIFLGVLVYLCFIYIVINKFTQNKKLAFLGIILFSFGPIEIWHNTYSINGAFAYILLISLFIFFKSKNLKYFWLVFMVSLTMMLRYYTASMVAIVISLGFIFSLFLKEIKFSVKKTIFNLFSNKKLHLFILIFLLVGSYTLFFSHMGRYTTKNIQAIPNIIEQDEIGVETTTISQSKKNFKEKARIFGLPLISWQDLFFIFCGISFVMYFYLSKKLTSYDKDIAYAMIPAVMLAFAFLVVHMPERAFSYLAFFGIISLKLPKKLFIVFSLIIILFIGITTTVIAHQHMRFFSVSDGEIKAAEWVSLNLEGVIFSDQIFIGELIKNGYYDINGFDDNDKRSYYIYYNNDINQSIISLKSLNASYIAISKRMKDDYLISLNFAQQPMENEQMYEDNFIKVYDNGDVRIYEVKNETSNIP
jgi:hypothetical protein